MENKLPSKMPNFEFVPELAQYMLMLIVKTDVYANDKDHYYLYSFRDDTPKQVQYAFSKLPGTNNERYDLLIELADAENTADGVEDYIDQIEPPCCNKDLLDWLLEDEHISDVDDVLEGHGGDNGLISAIAMAWCNVHANGLRDAATVLEKYLNCGEDE